jgi:putative transposase
LTVERQCYAAEVSRAGFYRHLQRKEPEQEELLLRERLQQLAVAHHRLRGYRPLTALLRREGLLVNRKRVLRLMREDNLLCLRRQKYVLTTDSRHPWPIYPNLTRQLPVTGVNQLWVADITYIRLRHEFAYLAVVLDAYSRRVIGWDLDRTLEAELAVRALKMALAGRAWKKGELIHHSDQGVQYASGDYTELLAHSEILISMSRRGNPYDNAKAERFMRTLKEEEVQGRAYANVEEARGHISEFLEETYNRQRLHSALRYVTPEEFEQTGKAVESAGPVEAVENQKQVSHSAHRPLEIPMGFPLFPQPGAGLK